MKKLLGILVLGLLWCNVVYALPKCKGEDYSKWSNCFGTYTSDKGWKYTGEFGNDPGKRHGKGTFIKKTAEQELKYVGHFKDDAFQDYGTLILNLINQNMKIEFKGFWEKPFMRGKETTFFDDGTKSIIVGKFKSLKNISGKMTYISPDGERYYGSVKNSKFHGLGTHYYKDGSKYRGEFKNNKRHGKGTFTWANGKKDKGIWENDKLILKAELNAQITNNLPDVWHKINNKKIEFEKIENNLMTISVVGGPFSDQNLLDFINNLNTKIPAVAQASLVSLVKSNDVDPSSWSFTIKIHLVNK